MNIKKLSILIPAYNEANTIHMILDKVKEVTLLNDIEKEIIIVNDCSKDNTKEVVERYINQHPELNIHFQSFVQTPKAFPGLGNAFGK